MGSGVVEQKILFQPAEITYFVFLVLFKDGGRRVSLKSYLLVSDVNQGSEEVDWVQDFLAWVQDFLPRAVKNRECALKVCVEGCGIHNRI